MPLTPEEQAELSALEAKYEGPPAGAWERAGRHLGNFPLHVTQNLGRSAVGLYNMVTGASDEEGAALQERWRRYSEDPANAAMRFDEPRGAPQGFAQNAVDLLGRDVAPVIGEAVALPFGAPKTILGKIGTEAARGAVIGAQSGNFGDTAKSALMWGASGGVAGIPGKTLLAGAGRAAGQAAIPVVEAAIDPEREILSRETGINALVQGGFGALTDPQLGGRLTRSLLRRPNAAPETPPETLGPPNPYEVAPEGYSTPLMRLRELTVWEQMQRDNRASGINTRESIPDDFHGTPQAAVEGLPPASTPPVEPVPIETPTPPQQQGPAPSPKRSLLRKSQAAGAQTESPLQSKPGEVEALEKALVDKHSELNSAKAAVKFDPTAADDIPGLERDIATIQQAIANRRPSQPATEGGEQAKLGGLMDLLKREQGGANVQALSTLGGGAGGAALGYATGDTEEERLRNAGFGLVAGLGLGYAAPRAIAAGRQLLRRESTGTPASAPPPETTPARQGEVQPEGSPLSKPTDKVGQVNSLLERHRLEPDSAKKTGLWDQAKKLMATMTDEEKDRLNFKVGRPILGGIAGGLLPADDEQDRAKNIAAGAVIGVASHGLKRILPSGQAARTLLAEAKNQTGEKTLLKRAQVGLLNKLDAGKQSGTIRADERSKGISGEAIRPAATATQALREPQMEAARTNPVQFKAMDDFVNSDGTNEAALRAAVPDKTIADALVESKRSQIKLQKIISAAENTERADLIDKTLGTYGRRAYAIDLKPDQWRKDSALFQKVVDQWHSAAPSLDRGEVEMTLDRYLADRQNGREFTPPSSSKISQKLYIAKKPLTPELKQLLGEITDPIERQTLTTQKLSQSAKQAEFINQVSREAKDDGTPFVLDYAGLSAAKKAGKDVSDYVRLGEGRALGKLANKYVPIDVQRVLEPPPPGVMEMLGKLPGFRQLTGLSKEVVTVGNPATHARQIVQMPLFMLAARANPKFLHEALGALADPNSATSRMLREENIIGANFAHSELGKVATKLGKNPGLLTNLRNAARTAYGLPDDALRATTYLAALKRFGGNKNKALDWTQKFTPNYGAANPLTKGLRNLPVVSPFVTFTSELLRISKNLANETIHGQTAADKAMAALGLSGLFGVGLGIDAASRASLDPKERKEWDSMERMMPDYQKYQAKWVQGKNKVGGRDFVGMSSLTPGGDILTLARMIEAGDWMNVLQRNPFVGIQAPMLKALVDTQRGENEFTGQPIETGGDVAQRWAEVFVPPVIPPGYEGKKLLKLAQSGGTVEDPRSGRMDDWGRAAKRNLLGVNVQSAKRDSLLRKQSFERDEKLRRIASQGKAELRTTKDPQQRQVIQKRTLLKRQQVQQEYGRLLR